MRCYPTPRAHLLGIYAEKLYRRRMADTTSHVPSSCHDSEGLQKSPRLSQGKLRTMQKYCVIAFTLAVLSRASAGTIAEANAYIDTVLDHYLPTLVRSTPVLYPFVAIPDFHFKILKTGITNRDLKVNITEGGIHGFRRRCPPSGQL
ncbi:hypothetical protein MTO96_019447 [Rhipicephalus appendiculatus]